MKRESIEERGNHFYVGSLNDRTGEPKGAYKGASNLGIPRGELEEIEPDFQEYVTQIEKNERDREVKTDDGDLGSQKLQDPIPNQKLGHHGSQPSMTLITSCTSLLFCHQ